jgi:hypothetical protein
VRLKQYLDLFGSAAVLGRKLYAREIFRMITAENIQTAYQDRRRSNNWTEWVTSNPTLAAILAEAEKLAQGIDNDG